VSLPNGALTVTSLPPQPKRAQQRRRIQGGAEVKGRDTCCVTTCPLMGSVTLSMLQAVPV
jgi:hypothetical protein